MEPNSRKHISGKILLIPFSAILLICTGFSVAIGASMVSVNKKVEKTTADSLAFNSISDQFNKGSDTLTNNLRLFVSTGDQQYIDSYFEEAKVTKNREKAMEQVEAIDYAKEIAKKHFSDALMWSNTLMNIEYHAMKLISLNYGTDISNYPEVVSYRLPDEELTFTAEERTTKAFSLIDGEEYSSYKTKIYNETNTAFEKILEYNDSKLKGFNKTMGNLLTIIIVTTSISCIFLILSIFILVQNMLWPMLSGIKSINKDEPMDSSHGLSEYTTLANAYNKLLARRDALEAELRITANTDPLTGLPNRNAINEIIKTCGDVIYKNIAIVSFDLNGLKEMNDAKGHKAGDDLLCSAADCILDFFGNDARNNCCRIGGDEFTAFLIDVDKEKVQDTIVAFKDAQHRYSVSIACGYSFRKNGTVHDMRIMYEEADEMMYKEKAKYYKQHGIEHKIVKSRNK